MFSLLKFPLSVSLIQLVCFTWFNQIGIYIFFLCFVILYFPIPLFSQTFILMEPLIGFIISLGFFLKFFLSFISLNLSIV